MEFNAAPCSELIRLRSYSRRGDIQRETWMETCDRVLYSPDMGLQVLGKFTPAEMSLIDAMQRSRKAFGSSRYLWVGGTKWFANPENNPGAYNCTSFRVESWEVMGMLKDLAMQGCGTGAVIEPDCIAKLPAIKHRLEVEIVAMPGTDLDREGGESTLVIGQLTDDPGVIRCEMFVGDSRQGWVSAYQQMLEMVSREGHPTTIRLGVDLSAVRPAGEVLKGFGGVSNPIKLPDLFTRVASITNQAVGRQLTSVEACLLIDEAASVVVAGNIRRSAGMRQGSSQDAEFAIAKDDLWTQDEQGNWRIDPERDALRMANHTRVYHQKPTLEECVEAVRKQFYSGEGAIMWAGEAVARSNADLLTTTTRKQKFLEYYDRNLLEARDYLQWLHLDGLRQRNEAYLPLKDQELDHRMHRYGINPCGEIIGNDFFCNLGSIHLNLLDPRDLNDQERAFKAGALQVSAFLQRGFTHPLQQASRELDPIVGVSFTGAFTFFVNLFGTDWLAWWQAGRPEEWAGQANNPMISNHPWLVGKKVVNSYRFLEQKYLQFWKSIVFETVKEYCDRHGLKVPNRCTTLKPEGSQTLLTGVGCNGFQPPKGWYYIRRMTFAKNDPIALAAIDYGYSVVPSQSDKDEHGNLLNDPFDDRCTEWLVEVPVQEQIEYQFPSAELFDPSQFSVLAQFDWMMQVQGNYVTHNTSATLELHDYEIEAVAERIYQAIQNDEGYISTTFLARNDAPFPRLPFERISREHYQTLMAQVLSRRKDDNFQSLLKLYDTNIEQGPQDSACSGTLCEIKGARHEGEKVGEFFPPVGDEVSLELEVL